jgi:phosphotransferase system IIA component
MKGAKMGVSTVTISIEEFEDLIESKKKLVAIKKVVDENYNKNILPATITMIILTESEEWEEAKKVADEADAKNLETLTKINKIINIDKVINMKGGAGNE